MVVVSVHLIAHWQKQAADGHCDNGQADDLARVRAARDELPVNYRTILALRYEAGLSHQEISAALDGLPIGTVKSRLLRARAALVKELQR